MSGREKGAVRIADQAHAPALHTQSGKIRRAAIYALLLLCAFLLYKSLSRLLFQVLFAALLAMAAKPIAALYEKKLSRPLSCLLAVLTLVLSAAGVVALLVPALLSQLRLMMDAIPTFLNWGQGLLGRLQDNAFLSSLGLHLSPESPGQFLSQAGKWLTEQLPRVTRGIAGLIDTVSKAFISPVLCYYFLRDREQFTYQLSLLIPLRHRKRMLMAMQESKREVGAYVRGQLLIAACVGALTAAGLLLIGVPAWLVLGILMGICEVIPYIGPIIGSVPIVLFALSGGTGTALWALGLTVAVQQLEGMVIAPRLMAGATGLHPVYVLLILTGGSMLFGIWGLLFSLPVFLCARTLLRTFLTGADDAAP